MDTIVRALDGALGVGLPPSELGVPQIVLRTLVVFVVAVLLLRIADKRFLAHRNAFDALLSFMLASTLSRAIDGSATFFGTLGAGVVLVFLHRTITLAACKSHALGRLVKGDPAVLVAEGAVDARAMRRYHVSPHDLEEDLRLQAGVDDLGRVKRAQLERNGEISVLREPRVVTIAVQEGVQTVRLEVA